MCSAVGAHERGKNKVLLSMPSARSTHRNDRLWGFGNASTRRWQQQQCACMKYALEIQVKQEYRLLLLFCCEMQIAADAAVSIPYICFFVLPTSWMANIGLLLRRDCPIFFFSFFLLVGVHKVNKQKTLASTPGHLFPFECCNRVFCNVCNVQWS